MPGARLRLLKHVDLMGPDLRTAVWRSALQVLELMGCLPLVSRYTSPAPRFSRWEVALAPFPLALECRPFSFMRWGGAYSSFPDSTSAAPARDMPFAAAIITCARFRLFTSRTLFGNRENRFTYILPLGYLYTNPMPLQLIRLSRA